MASLFSGAIFLAQRGARNERAGDGKGEAWTGDEGWGAGVGQAQLKSWFGFARLSKWNC